MKRLAFPAVVVFLGTTLVFADQAPIQVAGTVRSAKTGEALTSAAVALISNNAEQKVSRRTTTGPEGTFAFSGLPPGQYQVTIGKPGYQSFQATVPVTIASDSAPATSLVATLWPTGAIGGRVVDWDGEPVAEAEVRAYAIAHEPTGVALSLAAKGESDDLGQYRLFDLPAGKYVLQVSPPRITNPAGQFYADTPASYYPGAPAPSQALPVELNWGAELTRADVRISQGMSYAIAGLVWDLQAEGPCTRCVVQAVQHDGPYRVSLPQNARVSRNGAFVLRGLSSGEYSLVARRGSSKGEVAQIQVSIRDRHVEDARLTVGLQQTVTGEIVLENPPDGIDATNWSPRLSPVGMPEGWPRGEGKVTADRQFAIPEVPPARYRLELGGLPPGAYLKALRYGGQPLANPEIIVRAEAPVSGVQLVVGFHAATLQGKVRSPESAASGQARIFLLPPPGQAGFQLPKTTEANPDGSFSLASVAPGSYTLYALPASSVIEIFDPAVQTALRGYAKEVSLAADKTVNIDLSLATITP